MSFVLGFVGPVFWPYAYDDLIDYTFWGYGYDTFWPTAFDDVYEGVYGAYAPEFYAGTGYAGGQINTQASGHEPRSRGGRTAASRSGAERSGEAQICTGDTRARRGHAAGRAGGAPRARQILRVTFRRAERTLQPARCRQPADRIRGAAGRHRARVRRTRGSRP